MQYCFHHIPKTAGSTLQLLLSHREHMGELPAGSTLIVYPLYDKMRYYRVSNDPDFDPRQPIKQAFLRTYHRDNSVGDAKIVMGHYTNVSQPGDHYVWLRHPLERDISHFNYDCKYGNELSQNFSTHLSAMSGNFMTLWLYGKYLGRHDSVSMEQRYNTVREALKTKFKKVFDTKNFDRDWKHLSASMNVSEKPMLKSNQGDKDYNVVQKYSDLDENFKHWHKDYNQYDYRLYEEFCA